MLLPCHFFGCNLRKNVWELVSFMQPYLLFLMDLNASEVHVYCNCLLNRPSFILCLPLQLSGVENTGRMVSLAGNTCNGNIEVNDCLPGEIFGVSVSLYSGSFCKPIPNVSLREQTFLSKNKYCWLLQIHSLLCNRWDGKKIHV